MERKINSWMRKTTRETERKRMKTANCKSRSSTSAEVAADVAQRYGCVCLMNELMTLIRRHTIHPSTIYIQSSLLRVRSCHTTHAGITAQSSLRVPYVLASAHVTGSRDTGAGEENSSV